MYLIIISIFVFGKYSSEYEFIYFKLKYLIDQDVKIDTTYLSADPHMLKKKC
jgi:hypothetical protein